MQPGKGQLLGAAGLLLLAVFALAYPHADGWVSSHFHRWSAPAPWVTQADGDDTGLFWSPEDRTASPQAGQPVDGWRGLLLGMPLDVNRANERDWAALPGVGKQTAKAVIAARDERDGFDAAAELMEAAGIGPAKWEQLAPWVRCEVRLARNKGL